MYLRYRDYISQIQEDNLNAVISGKTAVRLQMEMAAQVEAVGYLVQRYDTDLEFTDTNVWSFTKAYKALERFYLDYPVYAPTSTYNENDLVTFEDNCYICLENGETGTFDPTNWTLLGAQYDMFYASLPHPYFDITKTYNKDDECFYKNKVWTARTQVTGILPTDPINGFQNWGSGEAYAVPEGTLPTDTNYFTPGDNRSAKLLQVVIDIFLYHIHSRISPRNIPLLREERYMGKESDRVMYKGGFNYPTYCALGWLQSAGGEGNAITADIYKLIPASGMRTLWGGNKKNINSY